MTKYVSKSHHITQREAWVWQSVGESSQHRCSVSPFEQRGLPSDQNGSWSALAHVVTGFSCHSMGLKHHVTHFQPMRNKDKFMCRPLEKNIYILRETKRSPFLWMLPFLDEIPKTWDSHFPTTRGAWMKRKPAGQEWLRGGVQGTLSCRMLTSHTFIN